MRALITGATGFAGSYLAAHLIEGGDQVLGCSERPAWHDDVPTGVREGVELFAWDISRELSPDDRTRVERFAPDCIFHLAAVSYPGNCGQGEPTAAALSVNVEGTRRVVELATSVASRPRFLLTSSAYVYAPIDPKQPYVDEQSPVRPTHPYGVTKLAAERIVLQAAAEQGLDGIVARAFQHTGPRHEDHYLLPEWTRQFAANDEGPIRVHSLNTSLDLTDVRDQVRAYRALAEQGQSGAVYNVGSGVIRQATDLMQLLQTYSDRPRPVVETLTSPPSRQNPIARNDKLRELTGWRALVPIEKTVFDTFQYWRRRLQVSS